MENYENIKQLSFSKKYKLCLEMQKSEMQKHKWLESEKIGYDLGAAAYYDWIKKYAINFRKWFSETFDLDIK